MENASKIHKITIKKNSNMAENKTVTVKEEIEISLELQRFMANKYEVTERTVQSAMRFEHERSSIARVLRAYALNNGGQQVKTTIIREVIKNPYSDVSILG